MREINRDVRAAVSARAELALMPRLEDSAESIIMRKILTTICAIAAAGVAAALSMPSANAREFPVCSYGTGGDAKGGGGGITHCAFETYEQCRATVSGVGGGCMKNPAFGARAQQGAPRADEPQPVPRWRVR